MPAGTQKKNAAKKRVGAHEWGELVFMCVCVCVCVCGLTTCPPPRAYVKVYVEAL